MKFRTRYDTGDPYPGIIHTIPSRAVQDQKTISDINYIVSRYADGNTGVTTLDLGQDLGVLQYGDATLPGDYSTALDLVQAVNEEFYELPSNVRKAFNHNPMDLILSLNDPSKKVQLQELGLLPRTEKVHEIQHKNVDTTTKEQQDVTKNP